MSFPLTGQTAGIRSLFADIQYLYQIQPDTEFNVSALPSRVITLSPFAPSVVICQIIAPDAILVQTALTGIVTDIDESVSAPDANWLTSP